MLESFHWRISAKCHDAEAAAESSLSSNPPPRLFMEHANKIKSRSKKQSTVVVKLTHDPAGRRTYLAMTVVVIDTGWLREHCSERCLVIFA
jgi:hypothetical protein